MADFDPYVDLPLDAYAYVMLDRAILGDLRELAPDPGTGVSVSLDSRCNWCDATLDLTAQEVHRCPVTQDTAWTVRDHDGHILLPYLPCRLNLFDCEATDGHVIDGTTR